MLIQDRLIGAGLDFHSRIFTHDYGNSIKLLTLMMSIIIHEAIEARTTDIKPPSRFSDCD